MKYIVIMLLFSSVSQATDSVVYLPKDQKAPYDGYLFTPDMEKEVRLNTINLKYSEELNASLVKINAIHKDNLQILDQRVKLYQDQSDSLAKSLESSRSTSFFEKTLYFGLGAIITGGIAYGVTKSLR